MKTESTLMKHRLNSLLVVAMTTLLLVNAPGSRAEETNETKPPPPKTERKVFFFEGGRPIDFILAMDKHFRTRLGQILSIPSSLARAQVPRMKIATEKPEDALQVYNHIQDPMLGQWRYAGPTDDPAVLALVADKDVALSKGGARVKAMSLGGLPKPSWKNLQEDVEVAREEGMRAADKLGGDRYEGSIHIQPESKILIASGSEGFIDMVESVVAAHRANASTRLDTVK